MHKVILYNDNPNMLTGEIEKLYNLGYVHIETIYIGLGYALVFFREENSDNHKEDVPSVFIDALADA